tara:strand:+ start:3854 stop:5845 length:1992 start_codon:yes stop_codon:yes gene_type:complete
MSVFLRDTNKKSTTSFKDQFKKNTEVAENNFYPFNQFDKFKNSSEADSRRDNTLIIKDYGQNETAQYSKPKQSLESFNDKVKNENAMAGSTAYLKMNRNERFGQALKYKNNDYLKNTYIRPEAIDGEIVPNGVIRTKQKTQEELRGQGVNSVRLKSEGKSNETGLQSQGASVDPDSTSITKYPQKKYYEQNPEDLLRTTGQFMKQEWRSELFDINTNRSADQKYKAPAKILNEMGEFRNNQPTNPTQFESYISDTVVTNPKSINNNTMSRNNQPTNPTQFETYVGDTIITNPVGVNNRHTSRNNQPANPTQFEEYMNNTIITNATGVNNKFTSRNNQPANPTQFEGFIGNIPTTNPTAINNKFTSRNNQPANPTQFEEFIGNTVTTNAYGRINHSTIRNNQPANPTQFEEFIGDTVTTNAYGRVNHSTTRNNQPANETYRNLQSENDFMGHGHNKNGSIYYDNKQPANPTQRDDDNEYIGPGERSTTLSYLKSIDKTRSGVVEEVLPQDYNGIKRAVADNTTDRKFMKNYDVNTSIQQSIDLTDRKLAGGKGQLSGDVETVGNLNVNGERGKNKPQVRGLLRKGYKEQFDKTRGKILLNHRVNTENPVATNLDGNPYVNNNVHKSKGGVDIIGRTVFLSDRESNDDTTNLNDISQYTYDPNKF